MQNGLADCEHTDTGAKHRRGSLGSVAERKQRAKESKRKGGTKMAATSSGMPRRYIRGVTKVSAREVGRIERP